MKKLRYLTYRIKWHLAPFFNFKSPVHVDLELTNLCNQSCLSCWWHNPEKLPFERSKISSGAAMMFLDECKKIGVKSVKFNFRGEPATNIKLELIIDYAHKLGLYTMINTNGIMQKSRLNHILNSGLDEMIISVDSFNPYIYKKIHDCKGRKDFNILLENIKFLLELKKEKKLKTKVKLNFHINRYNKDDIYINMKLPFKKIIRYTENREGEQISIKEKKKNRKKVCPHMARRVVRVANSKMFPCCIAYNEPDDLTLNKGIEKSWNGKRRKTLIKNYKKGIYTETCKNCTSGDIWR